MIFYAEDVFHIKGHGDVYCGRLPKDIPYYGFKEKITIEGRGNGKKFTVKGIETFGIPRPDDMIKEGEQVGFIVDPDETQEEIESDNRKRAKSLIRKIWKDNDFGDDEFSDSFVFAVDDAEAAFSELKE